MPGVAVDRLLDGARPVRESALQIRFAVEQRTAQNDLLQLVVQTLLFLLQLRLTHLCRFPVPELSCK